MSKAKKGMRKPITLSFKNKPSVHRSRCSLSLKDSQGKRHFLDDKAKAEAFYLYKNLPDKISLSVASSIATRCAEASLERETNVCESDDIYFPMEVRDVRAFMKSINGEK